MLKPTKLIRDNTCILCGKKAYKEIPNDVNIFDIPSSRLMLCEDHYKCFHVGSIFGQFQLNTNILSFILNLEDEVNGEQLREKLFEMVPGARNQFEKVIPVKTSYFSMSPKDFYVHLNNKVVGQEEAKKRISITVFEHLRNLNQENINEKFNILLLGPSGSGKTLIINSIAEKLNVPYASGDATGYSPTGFQGADVDSVIHDLYMKSNGNIQETQKGVVFIDEIDKLSTYHSQGTRSEALHTSTQSSMLKLIEGKRVKLPQSITGEGGPPMTVDTSKILFCFGGAFNGLHEIVGKKLGYKGRKVSLKNDGDDILDEQIKSFEIYNQASHEILVESLIEYGLSTELVGRIQTIVALSPLNYDQLKSCLLDLDSSPIYRHTMLFAESGYELTFNDDFIDEVINRVMKMGTGTRALNSLIKKAVSGASFDLLGSFSNSCAEIIISKNCIDNPNNYLLQERTIEI